MMTDRHPRPESAHPIRDLAVTLRGALTTDPSILPRRVRWEIEMVLSITSLLLILFCVIIIVLGIVKLHEYPVVVAEARNHPQRDGIMACSLMGLIVFPFWMFALVWAYGGVIGAPLAPVEKEEAPASKAEKPEPSKESSAA